MEKSERAQVGLIAKIESVLFARVASHHTPPYPKGF